MMFSGCQPRERWSWPTMASSRGLRNLDRIAGALLVAVIASLLVGLVPGVAQTLPELPRVFLDTTYVAPTGPVIPVPAGADFQAALNAASPGTTLVLQAGATYTGNFTLPANPGPGWIYIVSSALSSLPEGTRVTPAQASLMPKLVSPNNNPVLSAGGGAQFYRLAGIEMTTNGGFGLNNDQYSLVAFAAGHDITVDRSYVHGGPTQYVRQGIQLNNARTAVIDSYLGEFHIGDGDSQGIIGWNGPGPFKIVNNYIEGAAENILFGGADPSVANLVPSDIEIRRNWLRKPLSWYPGDPSYTGIHWTVKNLFELKNAQRVLIDGNILENCWVDRNAAFGQQGATGFVLTTRNQGGGCPWCVVQDVTITNNIVQNLGQGSVFAGMEGAGARRVLARNNFFNINAQFWGPGGFSGGANGRIYQVGGISDVTIDHNTAFQDGAVMWDDSVTTLAFTNNLSPIGGAAGTGSGFQGGVLPTTTLNNIFIGGSAGSFPPGNFFPATTNGVQFVNYAGGDYHLAATSPYKNAGTDGKDIGADVDALNAATACAVSGACAGPPPPPITSISLSPTILDFGSVTAGTTSVASNFWATNTGTTGVSVSGITVSGPFALSSTDCFSTPTWNGVMAPGTHCNVYMVFAPVTSGSATGTLTATAGGTSDAAALSGSGVSSTTLAVVKAGSGSGTVTSSPTGITCGTSCSASFPSGTAVTLTASPATGSTFSGWSGGGCSGTGSCIVTLSVATTVIATFTPQTVTLTVSKAGTGSGTVTSSPTGITCGATCSASYASGTAVTLTTTPSAGSTFSGWSGGGCSGTGSCIVTLSAAT